VWITKVITNSNKNQLHKRKLSFTKHMATKYQESEVRWAWGWFRAQEQVTEKVARCACATILFTFSILVDLSPAIALLSSLSLRLCLSLSDVFAHVPVNVT
jgi:hypothetical protein